jgi:hypothetical protein
MNSMLDGGLISWGSRTPGSLVPQSPPVHSLVYKYNVIFVLFGRIHFTGEPFFLIWRYLRRPPGVLIMRTLLEEVLYDWRRRYGIISHSIASMYPKIDSYVD